MSGWMGAELPTLDEIIDTLKCHGCKVKMEQHPKGGSVLALVTRDGLAVIIDVDRINAHGTTVSELRAICAALELPGAVFGATIDDMGD